jgi:Domain of unknown function (DUF1902)
VEDDVRECVVVADWDSEAHVWVATSEDVPGLATEADSEEHLVNKLKVMVPELLEVNGHLLEGAECGSEFVIHYNKDERVQMYA